jgi:lipopolysaccharide transport system permease protein
MTVTQTQVTAIAQAREYPIVRIAVRRGWLALDLAELWAYWELLYFFVWRDIKVRYKQTVIGAAWAVLQPLMAMLVFSLFFGQRGGLAFDQVNPSHAARDRGPNRQFWLRRS